MQGKIIKISDYLGFIEYDFDKRISFNIENQRIDIGDIVEFEIIETKLNSSEQTYQQASITKISSKQKSVDKQFLRLSKAARNLNVGISNLVKILNQYGFDVDQNPNTKISEEQYQVILKHFSSKQDIVNEAVLKELERGTVIETRIKKIIYPSLVILEFTSEKDAILQIHELAWNLARAEKSLVSLKENDKFKVVILENTPNYTIVSRKHLLPKPSETKEWQNAFQGQKIVGTVQEILSSKLIIKTDLDFYGTVALPLETINNYELGNTYNFILKEKDDELQFLNLLVDQEEVIEEIQEIREDFQTQDTDLVSFKNFKRSTYFTFANKIAKEKIEQLFSSDDRLFSSAIVLNKTLYISFGFNTTAWEKDYKNTLLPYLNGEIGNKEKEREALNFLESQKYWIRINTWVENQNVKNNWVLFNEEIYLSGFANTETDTCDFIITNLTLGRSNKSKSRSKENSLNSGTFLLNSPIKVISPFESKPIGLIQKELFLKIQNKISAFEILNKLKKETGAILRDEGLSITIFDKFLEYQETNERRGTDNSKIKIENYKQIPSSKTDIAIEIYQDIEDLIGEGDVESQMITIKTEEKSHKESKDNELVWYSDAFVEASIDKTNIHIIQAEKPIEQLKNGFYIEKKVSLRQYQVQREVIKDFFDKKLKLDHIESLLLRPEKIQAPDVPEFKFINPILADTEVIQPNNNQIKAVKKAVGNNNIFLIQGPPGTGKTTVISEIVEQLIRKGERVLVTSQTHIAVDNVLEKVSRNKGLSCIRIGNVQRIKEDLKCFQIDNLVETYSKDFEKLISTNIKLVHYFQENNKIESAKNLHESLKNIIKQGAENYTVNFKEILLHKNFEFLDTLLNTTPDLLESLIDLLLEWKENILHEKDILIKPLLYKSVNAVFATCIGIRTDKELTEYGLTFNTVIIDEAGKANISESFASISMAKKVILVGDQMQLPPYLDGSLLDENEPNSFPNTKYGSKFLKADIEHALKTSFFEFLVKRIDTGQFPKENMELLNYQHRMHPHIGEFISESFYEGKIKMGEHTIKNVLPLDPPFDKEVVFIDTSTVQKPFESFDGFSAKNDAEAICISNLIVPKLINSGLSQKKFAIIAPYKSQVVHIKKHLKAFPETNQIDVSTLDSFQGMEFDVIVFSFTRSAAPDQKNKKVGFLDDARRLNVALSRAKKKLILVGNSQTLIDSRSHFDTLFNYTGLYSKLVSLSKKESIGNFVSLTDYNDLKTPFEFFKEKNKLGSIVNGRVKWIESYGAFIDLGGVDGLVHISDLSHKKVNHPEDIVSINQNIKVKIIKYDSKKRQISLGLKQALPDPWDNPILKTGNKIMGEVKQIADFGLFIELTCGINGLLHVSAIPNTSKVQLKQFYQTGMPLFVEIKSVNKVKKQISLKLIKD